MRKSLWVLCTSLAVLWAFGASLKAATLYTQPYNGYSPAVPAQVFPDKPTYTTEAFDDFTVPAGGWTVTGATFYGQEQGTPSANVSVDMQFLTEPGVNNVATTIGDGSEDASGNLNFTGLNTFLPAGTYWITAWVTRASTDGQWFWDMTDVGNPIGSEFYIQNPGGGLLPTATNPTPGSDAFGTPPSDLAFSLYGTAVVPEPTSAVIFAAMCIGALIRRRRTC